MKNTKRFLALVLALTMCVATLATVSAATSAWYASAVDYIETCGIDTIGTKAATKITRNDFVYWLAKVVTRQVADGAWDEAVLTDELTFADVTAEHHYAAIAHSQQMGWLKGDGNNKFYPDKALTLAELSAMVVRVMGYENKVTGAAADWKYNYMLVANLYCNAFDSVFMAQTGTADPDYELSYGEAAYVLATIMNFPAKPVNALESLTADGYDLGAWFRGNTAGTSTYTAVVTGLDYVIEMNQYGVNHTTSVVDEEGQVDLIFTYADGSQQVVPMDTLDFQGYIRVSQGLPAEVDWRNEEVYRLDYYVTNGTIVSVKVDNASGEFVSIKVLDNKVVDTFAVLKATSLGSKYVPWLANKTGSGDYTFELPVAYTEDVHFDFVDVVYAANGDVVSAAFQIGGQKYTIASTTVGATNLAFYSLLGKVGYGENAPTVDELDEIEEALATPLTAAEVYDLVPTTARGMARFVITDVDGDGYFDQVVVTDNFEYIYRSKLNANPAVGSSPNEDKSYEMGAVVAGYKVTTVTASVSTDMFGLDLGSSTSDVVLVIPATNKRYITQAGAGYLGGADGNPNGGHSMLPAYLQVKLPFELKSAYIESATALEVDGYYRVVLVNLDGTRTTAYMPIPTGTQVQKAVEVEDPTTGDTNVEYYDVYKTARGWTMYRLDEEFDSVEGWYAYEDNDVYAADEEITTEYLGQTEVDTAYLYVIYDYIANTTSVPVTINGTDTVVTLDSSTWVPFITDYVREEDGGVNGYRVGNDWLVNVDDTAAWMVNKYIKYVVDEDSKIILALDTTKVANQAGLIVSVDKTETGLNTYNVTLGLTTTQTTNDVITCDYGETRWTYLRWGAWHNNTGSIGVNMGSSSVQGRFIDSGATNKYTETEKYEQIGIDLLAFVQYMDSQVGNVVQLSAAEGGVEQVQSARNTAAYYCNALKALREGLRALTEDELAVLGDITVDTTFGDLVGTTAETKTGERLATSVARYVIVKGTALHYASATTGSLEAMNNYIATVDDAAVFDLNTTLGDYLEALLPDEIIDAEAFIAAFADDGDPFEVISSTYVFEELQQACDVYMSGYWDNVKTNWTYGNNYISGTLEYRGVYQVITREVRASASSLLDWANYEAYNRIFADGRLVHDIEVGEVLEGYHLSYGEFYQDAGELAILKYIGEDAEGTRAHFYADADGKWSGFYFSANNALGDNAWESKGVMHFVATTLSEANSLLPVTDVVLIEGPTKVANSEDYTSDDHVEYTAQYEVKFARNPYYLRTSNPAYTKYWSVVQTAIVTGTTVGLKDAVQNTWIPVVDNNGVQIVVALSLKTYWESRDKDDAGAPAKYKVLEDGTLFRLNTEVVPYKLDAEGNIITKTTYDYDHVVDTTAVEYDVAVKPEEMKAMVTTRPLTKADEGYFPGAYALEFAGETYIASNTPSIVVMSPDYKTGNVVGKAYTPAELYQNNLGVWATRQMLTHSTNSLKALTLIGETVSLTAAPVVDPGEPTTPVQTTNRTVFVANGESVIEQLETGRNYVVKSLYSAVELPTGNEVGSISVPYSTYVEAKASTTIEPVITAGKFYLINKDNVIVSGANVTWYDGTITKAYQNGGVEGTLNGVKFDTTTDVQWAFFYLDLDHTYLALASDKTSVSVAAEATAKTGVTTAETNASKAKAAYESAVAKGLSSAKIASYKEAYDSALAAVTTAEEAAVAKYLDGTFWGVANSPAYNYLVIGKLLYQDDPTPITFKYTVMGGVYCVIVNSFFNASFKF